MNVLVLEDEALIAMDVCDSLSEAGYSVTGPFQRVRDGLKAVEQSAPDLAILDVYLVDGDVFDLADQLATRNVPMVFHSGHATSGELMARYPRARHCAKPCSPDAILAEVAYLLRTPATASAHSG